MFELAEIIFNVIWQISNIPIDFGNGIVIRPWQFYIFCIFLGLLLRMIFKKSQEG